MNTIFKHFVFIPSVYCKQRNMENKHFFLNFKEILLDVLQMRKYRLTIFNNINNV